MTITETSLLDVHAAACLAGGPARVVDAALVALVETGRVRVSADGLLTPLDRRARDDVESAVLDAVGTRGHRTAGMVRQRAGIDPRVCAVAERLVAAGLLAPRRRGGTAPTRAGRRVLRELRATVPPRPAAGTLPALHGTPAGTSAAEVAMHGPAAMPDPELRAALFESSRPGRIRRRGVVMAGRRAADVAATASLHSSSGGYRYGFGGAGGGSGGDGGCSGDGGGGCG